jgi:hydroxypyruvate isomerase
LTDIDTTHLRWSANLSMLWRELPFLDRFQAAADAGFDTVEFWWPRGEKPEDVEAAVAHGGLAVAVLNMDAGDLEAGERGYLNRRECLEEVLVAGREAVQLARAVGCPFVNSPVGKDTGAPHGDQIDAVVDSLRALTSLAEPAGVTVTVEPLNRLDHPTYLISSSADGRRVIDRVGSGVALLYDAYHLGMMGEDIVAAVAARDFVHVQVADAPGRHEPGTGHLPFTEFFDALERSDYGGYVGLEYAPSRGTDDSLRWLRARRSAIARRSPARS